MSRASGCLIRPAASVHSHKLCTAFMSAALASKHSDFQLFTWTPVSSISQTKNARWKVETDKGTVMAEKVVLCTNAHTRELLNKHDGLYDQ